MTVGKIKWYDQAKGYGYILQLDGQEIYFHYTAIAERQTPVSVGTNVTYDLIETRMGFEASNVKFAP